MDYEKKYKEALERAKQFSEKPYLEDSKGIVEYIFPELAESEDERIRKALIKLVKKAGEGYENVIDGVSIENAISWLEKQGEQKSANTVKDVWKNMRLEVWAQASGNREANVSCDNTKIFSLCDIDEIIEKINDCQIEQKPAEWSEEDEEIISVLNAYAEVAENDDCPLNAERIRKAVGKLEFLRPQSTWKPSKEQLIALRQVISGCSYDIEPLVEIEEQLKKLREE